MSCTPPPITIEESFTGTIVSRRSMGRKLAFCTIECNIEPTAAPRSKIKLLFRADTVTGNVFPTKRSHLPFGGVLHCCCRKDPEDDDGLYRVTSYSLLNDPQKEAQQHAQTHSGGISHSHYLKVRHEFHQQSMTDCSNQNNLSSSSIILSQPIKKQKVAKDKHGSSSPRTHDVFCQFLLDHLLRNDGTDRVLDVAGGKGRLSLALANLGIRTTVMDPVQRKPVKNHAKKLVKKNRPVPEYIYGHFCHPQSSHMEDAIATTLKAIESHTCLVGLHSDQATEDIVDMALQYNKSFAVVPCCVFPDLFTSRRLQDNKLVRSYEDFIEYLRSKDPGIQSIKLDFEGKSICLFRQVFT